MTERRPETILKIMAESAAESWAVYPIWIGDAVDPLQDFAVRTGLVQAIGQDRVQAIIAEPFARIRKAGDPKPISIAPELELEPRKKREHRTAQSTVDAFWFVVSLNDAKRLKTWLKDHPADVPTLLKLMGSKSADARAA